MSESIWKDDGHGITTAGDVGGDIQAGEAYSRRFVHTRLAGRHIEVHAYPVANCQPDPGAEPTISLEIQTELMVATDPDDPGGTEVWSDLEYSDLPERYERTYPSVEAAEEAAQEYLRTLDPARDFTWDGRPEMGPASVLKYGEMLGKLAHEFSSEQITKYGDVVSYVMGLVRKNDGHPQRTIELDYDTTVVTDSQGRQWRVSWLMDTTRKLGDGPGGWVIGVYWQPFDPSHTHYSPYAPPRQVVGTLLDCPDSGTHDVTISELWADYRYNPYLVPSPSLGLPGHMERDLLDAYMNQRVPTTVYAITDIVPDDDLTYRVKITNRTAYSLDEKGPTWHTETWGLDPERGWVMVPVNPHPGYEHRPAFCPNCGH